MNPQEENEILRELLWLRHGCPIAGLYGDDGEMQCGSCIIDFKRDSAESIKSRFEKLGKERLRNHLIEKGQLTINRSPLIRGDQEGAQG